MCCRKVCRIFILCAPGSLNRSCSDHKSHGEINKETGHTDSRMCFASRKSKLTEGTERKVPPKIQGSPPADLSFPVCFDLQSNPALLRYLDKGVDSKDNKWLKTGSLLKLNSAGYFMSLYSNSLFQSIFLRKSINTKFSASYSGKVPWSLSSSTSVSSDI